MGYDDGDYHLFINNYLLDSKDTMNIIPQRIIDPIGLIVTQNFHAITIMDNRDVKIVSFIKHILMYLNKFPQKRLLLDIVIMTMILVYQFYYLDNLEVLWVELYN